MPETPNHGYNVPNEGEQDWHEPLNENFEQFDTDVEIRDELANVDDYQPREGAKFFATDIGRVYIGTGSEWKALRTTGAHPRVTSLEVDETLAAENVSGTGAGFEFLTVESNVQVGSLGVGREPSRPLEVTSDNNWNLDSSDGDVRIGDDDHRLAVGVSLGGSGAGTVRMRAKGGTEQLELGAGTSDTVTVQASSVTVDGDLDVSGSKNFTQSVETDDGEREVVYTASEAPTARTETSGVAQLKDGRAEVDLPEHFAWVTSDEEPLVVQTTPYGGERGMKVVERSTERVVVEALAGEGDYEFAYTVRGTRAGHADEPVVREPSPERADGTPQTPADD